MSWLPIVILPPLALGLGLVTALTWQAGAGAYPSANQQAAASNLPPSLAASAQAPSQLQAVLQGPRHRVASLAPIAAAKASLPNPDSLYPARITADVLLESADGGRRSHLHAQVVRSADGFALTLYALDDHLLEPAEELSWQPGQRAADARDRLVETVCRSLLVLEQELRGGERQAFEAQAPLGDSAVDEGAQASEAKVGPILLLSQAPVDGRYRVLSTDDLDEIQMHADGNLLWLRSSAAQPDLPTLHSALRLQPIQAPAVSDNDDLKAEQNTGPSAGATKQTN